MKACVCSAAAWLRIAFPAALVAVPVAVHGAGDGSGPIAMIAFSPEATTTNTYHIQSSGDADGDIFDGGNINTFLGADTFYGNGFTGTNTTIYNYEAGHAWSGHETLGHVANTNTAGSGALNEVDRHATWATFAFAGRTGGGFPDASLQRGIAYGATAGSAGNAVSWSGARYALSFGTSGFSEFRTMRNIFPLANVVNSSWGGSDPEGDDVFTIARDAVAFENPRTTWVVSAGNSGPGTNTVGSPGSGYNSITVGATSGTTPDTYDMVASFSSRGPQPSPGSATLNRATVDILAPGDNLTLAYYGGETGGNRVALGGAPSGPAGGPGFYSGAVAGTSFSAPIVAGGAGLVNDVMIGNGYSADGRDARVVKAILLNAADKLDGWDNGQSNVAGVIRTSQSLDYAQGAGQMDLEQTYHQIVEGTRDVAGLDGGAIMPIGWDFGALPPTDGTMDQFTFSDPLVAGSMFTGTLAWFRDRFLDAEITTVADTFMADLDLELWNLDTASLVAISESRVNNVEHLQMTIPTSGNYAILVRFFDGVGTNPASVPYGLAWNVVVPEPATWAALVGALALVVAALRRRR